MNRALVPSILLLLISTACSSGGTGSYSSSGDQLEEIKARVLELQRQAAITRVELDRLRQEVAMLRALRSAGVSGVEEVRAASEEPPEPQQADPEPAPPPTGIESTELEPESVPEGSIGGLAGGAPPAATSDEDRSTPFPTTGPPAATGTVEPLSPEAQRLYDRGYTFYHQGNYVDAEAAFQLFLKENPGAELSDNASYWIGESRYARGDQRGALAAFRETLERYPRGNKVPDALLKIADCLAAMGDNEGARISYGEVISRFPNTAAAVMAQERRQRLD